MHVFRIEIMVTKPKFDYDSPDFYDAIRELASRGCTDSEIANGMEMLSGEARSSYPNDVWPDFPKLSPETFSRMKNGKYKKWSDEQNAVRSERIGQVLARARDKINIAIRGTLIEMALGKIKTTSVTYHRIRKKCECKGKDKACPQCGGTGWYDLSDRQLVEEREQTVTPSLQLLTTWLHHHDTEWRRIDLMKHTENNEDDLQITGIDINVVYSSKKDLELQEKNHIQTKKT